MPEQEAREKFTEVVDACYQRIFRGALAVAGDRHLAEELVQETFVTAFKKFDRFSGNSSPFTWLYGIMLNKYRDHCRKKKLLRRLGFVRPGDSRVEADNVGDADIILSGELASRDDCGVLVEAVNRLPFKMRTVIAMHYFDDLPLDEIAGILKCHVGTVKSRLFNARKRLHHTLKGKLKDGAESDVPRS
jgi:RNA polymerase sigma-70 factor (ECF subfamily)